MEKVNVQRQYSDRSFTKHFKPAVISFTTCGVLISPPFKYMWYIYWLWHPAYMCIININLKLCFWTLHLFELWFDLHWLLRKFPGSLAAIILVCIPCNSLTLSSWCLAGKVQLAFRPFCILKSAAWTMWLPPADQCCKLDSCYKR